MRFIPPLLKGMYEMKRKLALIMSLAMMTSAFTACGENASNPNASTTAAVTTTAATTAAASTSAAATEAETTASTAASQTTAASSSAADSTAAQTTVSAASTAAESTSGTQAEEDEENYNTGDAKLDNVRNQDNIGEKELLVLSFGTSFNDSRRLTIGAIEGALEKAFSDYSVRRGFTANIVIDHVKKRDGILIDDVDAALKRAMDSKVKTLVVQPTHLMDGLEYNDLIKQVGDKADAFEKVVFGKPLLTSDDDFKRVETAIVDWTKEYDDGKTAICFMGHGTEATSNAVYQKMQDLLTKDGHKNYFVGTVEASPSLDDVLAAVKKGDYKRVILEPLMVVAGDHANNDMAGDDEDSWKTAFTKAGYEVKCLIRGLGENEAIQQIYVDHAKAAIDSIK